MFAGDPLSQHDRDFAMSHMHGTRKMFLDAVAGLTPAQWNFKASPEKWSIAECAEHIAVSESYIFGAVEKLLAGPSATPEVLEKTKGKDEAVVKMVPDRSAKFQAPEPIKPKKLSSDPSEYVEKFKASRDAHIAYVEKTGDSMRDKVMPHPAMGPLDAYQWLLLVSAHCERHTLQILEVKAAAGYPAK
jgi:DinB superfamily